jgi:hypothetical protein
MVNQERLGLWSENSSKRLTPKIGELMLSPPGNFPTISGILAVPGLHENLLAWLSL